MLQDDLPAGLVDKILFAGVSAECSARIGQFAAQNLSNLVWSCAKIAFQDCNNAWRLEVCKWARKVAGNM
eukprot:340991-Amphidinium_carterae.2